MAVLEIQCWRSSASHEALLGVVASSHTLPYNHKRTFRGRGRPFDRELPSTDAG